MNTLTNIFDKIIKKNNKGKERELEALAYEHVRELKSLLDFLNDEEENTDEQLYNYIIHEYDNIVRYPPKSSPPILNFDNPYSIQKGLNTISDRFEINNLNS